jgi:hypothetical protein
MSLTKQLGCAATCAVLATLLTGCASGPKFGDPFLSGDTCDDGCTDGCTDGCCEEPKRWSADWYALKSGDPVGSRQVCKKGKLWPPKPRPVGPPQQFSHRYHAAHYWPLPYICQDRAYVREVVNTQVANGWTQETTLYEYHFEPETQILTHAGLMHLRWILLETPPERRVAFVQAAWDEPTSQARLENVRAAAFEMVGQEVCPPVMLRVAEPTGTPAEYVDSIQRAIRDSLPEPRIQYQALPTGGAGGG